MAKGNKAGEAFGEAMELARSGRFKNVAEVESALGKNGPSPLPEMPKVVRGVIDGTCFRARRAKHWDT
jgi:hypothetical protein